MAYPEYFQGAWIAYLVASIGLYLVWFFWTKNIRNADIKQYVRLIPAVLLFTPAIHQGEYLAPAFIVALGELFTNGPKEAMQGVVPLLIALLGGAILLAVFALLKRPKKER